MLLNDSASTEDQTTVWFLSRGATNNVVRRGCWGEETAGIATRPRNSSSHTVNVRVFYHISRVWGEHTVWPCQLCPWSIPWPSARASAEFHEPLSPLYRQTRTLPPGLASLPMYNQFTVHRSAATISDNYHERNRGRRGCFCRVSAKSTQLSAKLNSSSEKLLTNNRPFSSLSHQLVFNSCPIETNRN